MRTPRLCYISDGARGTGGRDLLWVLERALRGGLEMVVLRERERTDAELDALTATLAPLRREGLRVLVSRRLDLARAHRLDGVHLAADSVPVAEARAWLGAEALLGYSAHSGEEARRAAREGASYVTLSPIYPTESKPGAEPRGPRWLQEATRDLPVPALALGGVNAARVPEVLRHGAHGVAVVAAIGAAEDPEPATRELRRALEESVR